MVHLLGEPGASSRLAGEVERVTQEYLGPGAQDVSELAPEERQELLEYLQDELGIVLDEERVEALAEKPRLRLDDIVAAFSQVGREYGEEEDLFPDESEY